MLYINCPHCGMRSQNEFSYGGDASVKRPELNEEVTDQEWDNFVYNRKSLRGKHLELWQHISGCRQWIKVCLLYTSPSPRDTEVSRMPSSA